jgi:hypothetical protein
MDPTKQQLYTTKRSSGLNVDADPTLSPAIHALKADDLPTNWLLMNISSNNLVLASSGSGGAVDLVANLTDDEVYYGGLRATVDGKIKFFHLYFVGENVPAMKKGKASLSKGAAFGLIDAHGELSCPGGVSACTVDFLQSEIAKLCRCSVDKIVL